MTLKEKIQPHVRYWDCYNDEPEKYDHTNKLVKIADKFAIEFKDWCDNEGRFVIGANTTKELLEIYKK